MLNLDKKEMRLTDIIFAIICGESSALLINNLIESYSPQTKLIQVVLLFSLPILSIVFLWIAEQAARKISFLWQLAKHLLVGMLATLVDLEIYGFLMILAATDSNWFSGTVKAISFLISVSVIKFLGNKYWAFERKEKENIKKEFSVFLAVTFIGLFLDVGSFLLLTKVLMPQFGLYSQIWVKISVIAAAAIAAVWNFSTYKLIVFKK